MRSFAEVFECYRASAPVYSFVEVTEKEKFAEGDINITKMLV
jgi:hypothetical protein